MTSVVILAAVDRQKRPLLFAVSKEMPSKWSMEQLVHSARLHGLGDAQNVVLKRTVACDACGCCDVFPCSLACTPIRAAQPLCKECLRQGVGI